jgi:hypothetical protein
MSLLVDLVQGVLQEEVVRSGVESAEAGAEIKTEPLFKVRIWGTRGRIGIFYVVDTAKAQKGATKGAGPVTPPASV